MLILTGLLAVKWHWTPSFMNEVVSFYGKIYKQELSQAKLLHLYSSRVLKRFFIGKQEELLTGENPYIPISDKDGEEIIKTLSLKASEVKLRYFALARISSFISLNKYESTRIYPLFAFDATVTLKDEAYYLQIDLNSREVLKNNLPQSITGHVGFKKLRFLESFDFHFTSKLKEIIEKITPEADADDLLLYPNIWTDRQLKAFQKQDFTVGEKYIPTGVLTIVEKENNSFTTLSELEAIAAENDLSAPLKTLFDDGQNQSTEKLGIVCEELNKSQFEAIHNSNEKIVSIISGPPGTGKSFTIANLAAEKISKGQSVLISSKNKEALAVIEDKIRTQLHIANLCVNPTEDNNFSGMKEYLTHILGRKYIPKKTTFNEVEDLFEKYQILHDHHLVLEQKLIHQFGTERSHFARLKQGFSANLPEELRQRIYEVRGKKTTPLWVTLAGYYERIEIIKKHAIKALRHVNEYRIEQGILKNRADLRNYLSFLKARDSKRKSDLASTLNYNAVLKAFPVWLVRANDVSRVLPNQKEVFDLLIIDEATQCDIPSLIPLMQRAKKVVVVGDTRQLTHISFISKAFEMGCKVNVPDNKKHLCQHRDSSILHLAEELLDPMDKVELNEHFRSQFPIISFSNKQFYNEQLDILTKRPLSIADHVQFIQTNGKKTNGYIAREAELILDKIKEIITKETDLPAHLKTSIGLLSPFRKQVDHLFSVVFDQLTLNEIKAHKISVGTAFTFQGNERDLMFISLGLDKHAAAGSFTFLNRDDVFNVSITRARDTQMIYYSFDPSTLKSDSTLAHFFKFYAQNEQEYQGKSTKDDFCLEVQAVLASHGFKTWTNFHISGVSIDLLVQSGNRFYGIDLIGFPGEMEDYYALERYKMIQRGKILLFPLPYALWRGDKEKCIAAVLDLFRLETSILKSNIPLESEKELLKQGEIKNDFDTFKLESRSVDTGYLFELSKDNKVIGELTLNFSNISYGTAELHFFLIKKYRYQGLEEKLLEAMFDWISSENKFQQITVDIRAEANVERKILVKYGFNFQSSDNETKRKKKDERMFKVIRK